MSVESILRSTVTIMTPLLFACMGGLFTDLAGVLNIALEGLLLIGAFAALAAAQLSGSLAAGLAAAIFSSMLLSAVLAFVVLRLRSNVFIAGLAVNLFAAGGTVVLSQRIFGTRGVLELQSIHGLGSIKVPVIDSIPLIGRLLSGYSIYIYTSWVLLVLAWVVLYKTPFGFRLRSCGQHVQALQSLGLKPFTYRFIAFLVSGLSCGIGGAFLSLNLEAFVPNISAGKGWIALVVIYLGARKPQGLFIAAFIFGFTDAFSNYAQGILNVPADFILAIPYVFTLIVMVLVSVYTTRKTKVS
jgi:simple sugar transport system permease protein